MSSHVKGVKDLKIPLEDVKASTNNFGNTNYIAEGGFGKVYQGELYWSGSRISVAVKRLNSKYGQGDREFMKEITTLSCYKHKNLVSLVGFCDEGDEKILVYVRESRGSLDKYISSPSLTWMQRLQISIGAARGLNYLHHDVGPQHRVLHRDIKSSNILLDENWEAKVSDFGLSRIGPSNMEFTYLVTNVCGTFGYRDPAYEHTGVLTKESDVYSFGVVLFELLCGKPLVGQSRDGYVFLGPFAKSKYKQNKLEEFIEPNLRKQMKLNSLNMFSAIAYQCLKANRSERPTMGQIVEKLENALELQKFSKIARVARVGTWGTKSNGSPHNRWSFLLEKDHNLKMITIDHGDLIYSLKFTSESNGVLHTSNQAGGWNGGETVSEVTFDVGEEIISINGSIGTSGQYTIISSLSFVTNKRTHGPFGRATENAFFVPWDEGLFAGFYGLAGYYIDCIGVYLKASSEEVTQVRIWGKESGGVPLNRWSFQLEKDHRLKKITVDHGDVIYSLMFTTECRDSLYSSDKFGGLASGNTVSEVTFDWDEELIAINGTVGALGSYTAVSSLSFLTNKKTHGPFGHTTGTPFNVPWDKGSFAGFYGFADDYINGIGIYLQATI